MTANFLMHKVLEASSEVVARVLLTGRTRSVEKLVSGGLDHPSHEAGLAGVAHDNPLEGPGVDREKEEFWVMEEYLVGERGVELDDEEFAAGVYLEVRSGGLTDPVVRYLEHGMPLQLYFLRVKERRVNNFLPGVGLVLVALVVITGRGVRPTGVFYPLSVCLRLQIVFHFPGRSLKHFLQLR